MADTAKEPPKEKPKKKKSEGKKSEKKASVSENASEGAENTQKAESRKASATPDAEAPIKPPSRKPSATPDAEAPIKPPSRKPSATPDAEVPEKPSSRKPSATPETEKQKLSAASDQGELAEQIQVPERKKSSVYEEEDIPPEPVEPVSTYRPPPPATKRDINLLEDLDEDKLLELKEAFELFDLNHDGIIDLSDLRNTYMTLGKKPEEVDENEIQHMLSEAINPLDFDSFVVLLGYKSIELDPEEILREALSKWDYDGSGLISEERIKHDLMTWGDKFTQEEVDVALEDAPTYVTKKEVMIDYVKFCKILCGLRKKTKEPGPEDFMKH